MYAVDKGQPVTAVHDARSAAARTTNTRRRDSISILLSIFAAFGLVLAVVGVYGVMSTAVAQERQEIGVRLALGADGSTIARMVLARGSRLLLAGTAIGLVGSYRRRKLARRRGLESGGDSIRSLSSRCRCSCSRSDCRRAIGLPVAPRAPTHSLR